MAGRRQHYIPRFLQRGFLAEAHEPAERTWLHRRGVNARLVGIRDVGVGEYFYSKLSVDGALTLDQLITAMESGRDADLQTIRRGPIGRAVDAQTAARLTTHLTLRTAHVRSVFQQGATQVLREVAELLSDSSRSRDFLGIDGVGQLAANVEIVERVQAMLPADNQLPLAFAQRFIAFWIRENFDEFHRTSGAEVSSAMTRLVSSLEAVTRDGHNNALIASDQSRWERQLSELSWRTFSVSGAILPDCVALAQDTAGAFTPLILRGQQELQTVVVPVAHDQLLVGSKRAQEEISVEQINCASASCSDSFFISRRVSDGEGLECHIGQRCARVISAVVDEALSSMRSSDSMPKGETGGVKRVVAAAGAPLSFSLTCLDFGDQNTVENLGGIFKMIVQEVGREEPLDQLDGVTFAVDYAAAVEKLAPGAPESDVRRTGRGTYGRAVAKCIRMERAGVWKEHIVFEAGIGVGLMADDEDARALALHTVVSMLSHVTHSALYGAALNSLLGAPVDRMAGRLYPGVACAPGMYFSARTSAFSDPKAGERYATLVVGSLAAARDAVLEARLAYRVHGNLDTLLDTAVRHVSFVLEHTAEWLGHRDGLPDQDSFAGFSLSNDLKAWGLHLWLELFGRDLRRFYDHDGEFTSANVLLLSNHVERLLWTMQICPWLLPDGELYVSVPMGDDEQSLASFVARGDLGRDNLNTGLR